MIASDLPDATWLDTGGSYTGTVKIVRAGVAKPPARPARVGGGRRRPN